MEKLAIIQYQSALAITGAWQGSSGSKIYDELSCETLTVVNSGMFCRFITLKIIILFRILKINYLLTPEKCFADTFVLLFMQ